MCKYLCFNGLCASDESDARKNGVGLCVFARGTSDDMKLCPVYVRWLRNLFCSSSEYCLDDDCNVVCVPF